MADIHGLNRVTTKIRQTFSQFPLTSPENRLTIYVEVGSPLTLGARATLTGPKVAGTTTNEYPRPTATVLRLLGFIHSIHPQWRAVLYATVPPATAPIATSEAFTT